MIIKSRKIARIDIFIDLKVFWPSGPNNFDGFTGSRRDGRIGVDRHNGVGVSGEEIKPCYAKALRMCSISIARGRLLSQSKPNGMQMLLNLTVCRPVVSNFLERIYKVRCPILSTSCGLK